MVTWLSEFLMKHTNIKLNMNKKFIFGFLLACLLFISIGFFNFSTNKESFISDVTVKTYGDVYSIGKHKYKINRNITKDSEITESGYKFKPKNKLNYLICFENNGAEDIAVSCATLGASYKIISPTNSRDNILIYNSKGTKKSLDFTSDSGNLNGKFSIIELQEIH